MLTRDVLRNHIRRHLEGRLTLEDLAAWAEAVFRGETFEPAAEQQIEAALSVIRDAVDPHRFRWEEPDFEELLETLE